MICISILCFGYIANKSSDILSILKEVIIFPEKGDLFRIGKTNTNILRPKFDFSFVEFLDESKKLSAYAEEMPTTIYLHMETLKKVGRKVSIFVLTIRNKSLYSGKITTYLNIERMSLNLLTTLPKRRTEMQIIRSGVDGIKVQLWEAITRYRTQISENGLRGRIEMGLDL